MASNPRFSQTPIKLTKYDGLDRSLGCPEFVDLDADNDLDIVFVIDFDGPDYPIYYQNIGTDSLPKYVRDENMFAWIEGQFLWWLYKDLRMLDIDNDHDYDLFLYDGYDALNFIYYENIGDSTQPQWCTMGDTLFQELGNVKEINISNVLNDSLPQIAVISDSGAKFYRQHNNTLIEIYEYFNPIMNFGLTFGPTKIEFFKLPQDTSQFLIVNREVHESYYYDYQIFDIYKNVGSKLTPYWQLQQSKKGHNRLLKHKNTMIPDKYCYSDGFWSFSVFFDDLLVDQTIIEFENPSMWVNGSSTNYTDLASFDWRGNGKQDLIISTNNLWQEVGGWGIDSNFNMFLCISDFQLDTIQLNYSYDFNFPINVFEDDDPSSLYFDFADLDADNDQDMVILKTDDGHAGVPPYLRIYWNTGTDILPAWDTCETLNFDHYHWDKSVNLKDMDNDGDFDMIIGKQFSRWQKNCIALYKNIGNIHNPQFSTIADTLLKKSYAHPEFADLDGDGDNDMVVQYDTSISSHWTSRYVYYQNDSNDSNFVFTRIDSVLPFIEKVSAPHLVDIDNDTDHDLFLITNNGEIYFVENLTVTGIPGFASKTPTNFQLYQNYPNPFNSQTSIKYYIPKSDHIKIEIYDLLGRKIKTLINENQQRGEHKVIWNGRDENNQSVASGIYFYTVSTDIYSNSKKMLVLK
jgi:hypothetical protein